MNVGFIGLGNMGAAMARNLLVAGHHVAVYNRTRARAEALEGKAQRSRRASPKLANPKSSSPCSPTTKRSKP